MVEQPQRASIVSIKLQKYNKLLFMNSYNHKSKIVQIGNVVFLLLEKFH